MSWLDRQSFLGEDSERQLRDLTIAIVGLGGGGSHVAQQSAHVGVGGFVLIDDDRIDDTNLNRLVGATAADVERGERKVDIAERLIRGINPDARIIKAASLWQDAVDAVRSCDIVFGCVDNVRGKDQLEALCRRLMIPYIDQGMDVHSIGDGFMVAGQVVLSMPGGPCLRCLGVVTDEALDEEGRNYGAAGGKPQVVWPNGVLSSVAIGLMMQLVTRWHDQSEVGKCLEYDGNANTIQPSDRMRLLRGRPCPHRPVDDVGDPSFDIRRLLAQATQQAPAPAAGATQAKPLAAQWWARLMTKLRHPV